MKKQDKLAVWGLGNDFSYISKVLNVENEFYEVVVYVDRSKKEYEGRRVILPQQLMECQFDYIVICTSKYLYDIENELIKIGISKDRIINGFLFLENGFDYKRYKQCGWLNNWVINNIFSCITYADSLRLFRGKNKIIKLGRKSYVADVLLDDGGMLLDFELAIGNYTSISRNVTIQIGLNLDHDYNRVFTYGLSHLNGFDDCLDTVLDKKHELKIESDVWIGQNCIIKSGINIGVGAVVASNSYVVSDVPPYCIVGGNPARLIKKRFDEEMIETLLKTKWWEMSEDELIKYKDSFDNPAMFVDRIKGSNNWHSV